MSDSRPDCQSVFQKGPFTGHLTPFGKFQPSYDHRWRVFRGGLPHDTSATPMSDLFRGGIP